MDLRNQSKKRSIVLKAAFIHCTLQSWLTFGQELWFRQKSEVFRILDFFAVFAITCQLRHCTKDKNRRKILNESFQVLPVKSAMMQAGSSVVVSSVDRQILVGQQQLAQTQIPRSCGAVKSWAPVVILELIQWKFSTRNAPCPFRNQLKV